MPIKDNKSDTDVKVLYAVTIAGDGSANTPSIDAADYDNGVTFIPFIADFVGAGATVDVTAIEDSPDDSVWSTVSTDNIIGDLTDLTLAAQSVAGDTLKTVGVIGTQRYIRLVVTTSSFSDSVEYVINVNAGVEVAPGDS